MHAYGHKLAPDLRSDLLLLYPPHTSHFNHSGFTMLLLDAQRLLARHMDVWYDFHVFDAGKQHHERLADRKIQIRPSWTTLLQTQLASRFQ